MFIVTEYAALTWCQKVFKTNQSSVFYDFKVQNHVQTSHEPRDLIHLTLTHRYLYKKIVFDGFA